MQHLGFHTHVLYAIYIYMYMYIHVNVHVMYIHVHVMYIHVLTCTCVRALHVMRLIRVKGFMEEKEGSVLEC